MPRFFKVNAIILKRQNFAEADRFYTVFSRERGKLSLLAKGVRRLSSRKRPSLDIANLVKLHCVQGRSTPLITQVELVSSFSPTKTSLIRITQLYQILEIVDSLTVEDQAQPAVYRSLAQLLHLLQAPGNHRQAMLQTTRDILVELGFGLPDDPSETALKDHLESIIDRPLKSKQFLKT